MNIRLLVIVYSFVALLTAGMLGFSVQQTGPSADAPTGASQHEGEAEVVSKPEIHPYGEVTVHVGEPVMFPGLRFTVLSILQESRCPSDVQCIVAGTLFVSVETVTRMGTSTQKLELQSAMTTEDQQIIFTAAAPYPVSNTQIPAHEYLLTFSVLKRTDADHVSSDIPDSGSSKPIAGQCYVGGCSAQICSDMPDVVSTCEYKEAYACYQHASCERQSDGVCGWTQTPELNACLSQSS